MCASSHIPQSQALLKSAAHNECQMSCISNGQSNSQHRFAIVKIHTIKQEAQRP